METNFNHSQTLDNGFKFDGTTFILNNRNQVKELVEFINSNQNNQRLQHLWITAKECGINDIDLTKITKALRNIQVEIKCILLHFNQNQITDINCLGQALTEKHFQNINWLGLFFNQNQITDINCLGQALTQKHFQNINDLRLSFNKNEVTNIDCLGKALNSKHFQNLKYLGVWFRDQEIGNLDYKYLNKNIQYNEMITYLNGKFQVREKTKEDLKLDDDEEEEEETMKKVKKDDKGLSDKKEQEYIATIKKLENTVQELKSELEKSKQGKCVCQKKEEKVVDKKQNFISLKNQMLQQYQIEYKSMEEFNEKYKIVDYLGSGGFGKVELLQQIKFDDEKEKKENIEYAVKTFKGDITLENQENELISYYNLKLLKPEFNQYVLNVKDSYLNKTKQQISMVMPRAVKSLADEISVRAKNKNYFKPQELCYLLSCALLGQLSIETIGMVHRDIKLDNLLIMKDGSLVITDLGTTKRTTSHDFIQNSIYVGTYGDWSPEQIDNLAKYREEGYIEYNSTIQAQQELKSNDLYGLGLSFIQASILSIRPKCNQFKVQEYKLERQEWLDVAFLQLEELQLYSKKFIDLLKKMLDANPIKRYSLMECLQHLAEVSDW